MNSIDFAQEVLRLTNEFRAQNGLSALTMNEELAITAQKYSQTMAEGDFFNHIGADGSAPWDRAEAEGYTAMAMGENIAAGQLTPEQVVQGWIDSPGHRENMLNPSYTELGVGYFELENDTGQVNYNRYWTQLFGSGDLTPASPSPMPVAAPAPAPPMAAPIPAPEAPAAPTPQVPTLAEPVTEAPVDTPPSFAEEVLRLTNEFRAENGLSPLTMNDELVTTAQKHSQAMAEGDFFSHTGLNGSAPWDRAEDEGYTANAMGENIAAGQLTPEQVVQGWIDSPGHRANMLNPSYTELGVGYVELANDTGQVNYNRYWTQLFGSGDLTPTPIAEADEVDASIFEAVPQAVAAATKTVAELPVDSASGPEMLQSQMAGAESTALETLSAELLPESDFVGDADRNILKGNGLDNIMLGLAGNDRIKAHRGDDYINGGLGNDGLWGNLGNDVIMGDEGNDFLRGGHGSDKLVGGLDNDVLVGGGRTFWMPEIDTLMGDGGADKFVLGNQYQAFYTNNGVDDYAVITDLNKAEGDTIQLYGQQTYTLGAAPEGTANGQGLFIEKSGVRELIAVIQVDSNLAMTDSAFMFV